ncbi:endolytic transglycosylase MltG [Limnoraphis robusta]|uniref:Endolytic murein transglycosylase n=1 Tax=Limnoraphis robusta CCNP1315 TaxID=3110306 RepID=A0ABU5TW13_9CYAN|nr:endolytic transglycosylase MltG [Limnoraphis robusta]MEA5519091.1 endolytic transglycosylase MltG [Limnoraphis robusta CCNP1315]MEA5548844.1 endolytic transglycosylase MltG [Limnoraphis robusta CCNP1324]
MGRISKIVFYLVILPTTWIFLGWQGWSWWSWVSSAPMERDSIDESTENSTAVQITIPPGTSSQQIGRDLEAAGLIRSSNAWRLWARWLVFSDPEGEFKAGTYQLSPTQPLSEVAEKVWKGEVMQLSFTIPEGWSIKQMAEYFEEQGYFSAQAFMDAAEEIPYADYPWLPQNIPLLEGFLYPDTYQLLADQITPEGIIRQMLDRFQQVALPVYQKAKNQTNLSLNEWVALASIVEKEAVVASERRIISGVFHNRLKQGIQLAADPTVEYALGIRQTVDQPLTFKQVETPSPYNTYINTGLPPTAIASPGVASLEATLDPEPTEYLYFMARYDGTHIFSRTEAEHQAAIAEVERQLSNQ